MGKHICTGEAELQLGGSGGWLDGQSGMDPGTLDLSLIKMLIPLTASTAGTELLGSRRATVQRKVASCTPSPQ